MARSLSPAENDDDDIATRRHSVDGERLIALFSKLVPALADAMPSSSEVVLHDLFLTPKSIVAIHGNVSGLSIGDEPIEGLRDVIMGLSGDYVLGNYITLPDGRQICSTTMIIRDVAGTAVAALCINADLSVWADVQKVLDTMYGRSTRAQVPEFPSLKSLKTEAENDQAESVTPDQSVEELAVRLIKQAIKSAQVPVDLMHKRHKIEVVRDLKSRGMFSLRDGVDMVAAALNVTRFTIYNYLNQISDEE